MTGLPLRTPLRPPLQAAPPLATITREIEQDFAEARRLKRPPKLHCAVSRNGKVANIERAKRACIVSTHIWGWCDVCHRRCFPLHWAEHLHGFYCDRCCPCAAVSRRGAA